MIRMLIKNWWLLFLRGIFAIAFAIFIFVFLPFVPAPLLRQLAFAGLAAIFALFAFASGVLTMIAAVRGAGQGGSSWLMLADGIAVTAGGLIILLSPGLTLLRLISSAGGFTPLANRDNVLVTRSARGERKTVSFSVEDISEGRAPDVPLQAGDNVYVYERSF